MQQESKILCYQKAYQLLKEMDNVTDLGYPENKRNLEFTCNIGDIRVEYSLRLKSDLLMIRGTKHYPGLSDSELTEIGQNIVKNEKFKFTAYNENIIFQLSIPVVSTAEEEAMKVLDTETEAFFAFLNEAASEKSIPAKESVAGSVLNEVNLEQEAASVPCKDDLPIEVESTKSSSEDDSFGLNDLLVDEEEPLDNAADEKSVPDSDEVTEEITENNVESVSIASENASHDISHVAVQESSEEKEKRLLQLEWIAEKTASVKKKEAELDEREKDVLKREEESQRKLEEANSKTEYWQKIQKENAEKASNLAEEEKQLQSMQAELQKKESDFLEFSAEYDVKNNDLEKRINECAKKEQAIQEEETRITSAREELSRERDALNREKEVFEENQPKMIEENKSLKERCIFLQNELKDKDINIENLSKENGILKEKAESSAPDDWYERELSYQKQLITLNNTNTELGQSLETQLDEKSQLKEKYEKSEREIADLREQLTEKDSIVSKLEKEVELYKKSGTEMSPPDEILEDFRDTRKRNRELERELNDIKAEKEAEAVEWNEKIKSAEAEKEAAIKKAEEEKASRLPENRALAYLNELKTSGIILNQEEINGDICLTGDRDDCSILVNVNKNVIIVKKKVFRANKLSAKIQEWNENEVTETYFNDKKTVTCKKVLTDVSMDVNKILQKFVLIK